MEQKLDLQGKKGFKLLSKILLVVMIPMVLLVWMAGSAIKTVGTTTSSRLINHELKATSYAMEIYMDSLSEEDYSFKDGNLYKGNVNISERQNILDEFKANSDVDVSIFWNGERVATSIVNEDGKRPIGEKIDSKVLSAIEKDGYYFTDDIKISGEDFYGYYEQIAGTDCIMFTGADKAMAESIYAARMRNTIIFMCVITLIGCIFVCFTIVIVVKAIQAIVGNLDSVANGQLSLKVSEKLINRQYSTFYPCTCYEYGFCYQ